MRNKKVLDDFRLVCETRKKLLQLNNESDEQKANEQRRGSYELSRKLHLLSPFDVTLTRNLIMCLISCRRC